MIIDNFAEDEYRDSYLEKVSRFDPNESFYNNGNGRCHAPAYV